MFGFAGWRLSFVVIGFALDYGESPVELLNEDCPHHLVRKGHPRERNHRIAALIDRPAESVCPADDKNDVAAPGNLPLYDSRPFDRAVFFSVFVEQNHIVIRAYILENQFSFLLLNLIPAQRGNLLEFRNLRQGEVRVVTEPADVNVHSVPYPVPVGLPDCQHSDFHGAKIVKKVRRLKNAGRYVVIFTTFAPEKTSGKNMAQNGTRIESDLIGSREISDDKLYGVQTLRGIENFRISNFKLSGYPLFINGLAITKMGAAMANHQLGLLSDAQAEAIIAACREILDGKHHEDFPVDMIQGGAGTTTNMNANEVIANRALELMGHRRGEYQFCSPNDHVNRSQSTNDAYPTAIHLGLYATNLKLVEHLQMLIDSLRKKGVEFADVLKMGRTQLEDAVPMTLGQTFHGFASILEDEVRNLNFAAEDFLTVNMGATAIGTGIAAEPGYAEKCVEALADITGWPVKLASDLVGATSDTSGMVGFSAAMRRVCIKVNKICNDLRILASGPRCGLGEINLPAMQPGSSIMPGKVNPVIPEVMTQTAYKVMGNDVCVTLAGDAAQMELNAMEPVMAQCCFESADLLVNGFDTLRTLCIDGITANRERCLANVKNSIGIVTALNPVIGYKNSTKIAMEALSTGKGVYDLVLEHDILSKEDLDTILKPENMIHPVKLDIHPKH